MSKAAPKNASVKALRAAAMAYPQTVEDFPWGERAFKVAGKKVFLFMYENDEGGFTCSMKLPFRNEDALKMKGAESTGYGLGRAGWVTFKYSEKAKPPLGKLRDFLDESWRAVAPKKLSAAQPAPEAKG